MKGKCRGMFLRGRASSWKGRGRAEGGWRWQVELSAGFGLHLGKGHRDVSLLADVLRVWALLFLVSRRMLCPY